MCVGGHPHGLGISSLFKPGYLQREVLGGALEDRDGLGVDLCLGPGCAKSEQPTGQWRGLRRVK